MKRLIAIALLVTSCGKGVNSATEIPGPQGVPGAVGATGPAGPKGADGTQITVVQLCPGATVYPNTFVEVAFCINGSLYATYSANGGFSTEIPPGTYNSNGIGSSCSFTVVSGCQVN